MRRMQAFFVLRWAVGGVALLGSRAQDFFLWQLLAALGGLIAYLGWYDRGQYGWALLLFGPLLMLARTPLRAFGSALGYYLVLGWEEVAALRGYFELSAAQAIGMWVAHAAINALPWVALLVVGQLWRQDSLRRLWPALNLLVGSGLSVVGPWASISWGSPLFLAGAMYPSSGLVGVLMMIAWWIALGAWLLKAWERKSAAWLVLPVLALSSSLAWRAVQGEPARKDAVLGWHAVQTEFGRLDSPSEAVARFRWLKGLLSDLTATEEFSEGIVVLPESVVGAHRSSIDALMISVQPALETKKTLVLLHADKEDIDDKQETRVKDNNRDTMQSIVWAYGDPSGVKAVYAARSPVPWAPPSVRWYESDRSRSPVADLGSWGRVAFAVCFEGMLMEHWLRVARDAGKAEVGRAVGVANLWFLQGSSLEAVKSKQMLAFKRGAALAGLPLTMAVNAGAN